MKLNKVLLSAATVVGFTAATAVAANADSVTVQAGDTVSHIAARYNTTIEEIQKLNNLENVNLIFPGQTIQVSGEATTTSTQTSTQTVAQTQTAQVAQAQQQAQAAAQAQQQAAQAQAEAQAQQQAAQAQAAAQAQQQAAQAQQAQTTTQTTTVAASTTATTSTTTTTTSDDEAAAREWIANKESGGSYTVTNGQYIGKYQLSASYLNGDYSAENQERVAESYVASRYGSWANAKQHWLSTGWY
ncbi:extracellular protein [Ligilactobacillus apodemi DSM 16634 = JCM 16172]|uniref:Extracellular protein n=1 Tax=Ligilactobacillus apodemi DSM 16634 = JCM 16172 TaxID=1423724 RepID=A0A0R1TV62_9LACO|nr:LysM domain-containing protein [Ligilactobacillus apodemi]KRL85111.1 extracellular protein [Ligilactobacillus apodemi DSM 16634 = JCM 16172]MCR1902089.1 LysM peptidoglycan-binding domain-containing protein [Ligilactobacillus apodemi]